MKKEINIYNSDNCIKIKILKKYTSNSLSDKDAKECEKHLNSCKICNDLLEGIKSVNAENLPKIVSELNKNIEKKIDQKRKRSIIPVKVVSLAAMMFLIIAIAYFINLNLQNNTMQFAADDIHSADKGDSVYVIIEEEIPMEYESIDEFIETEDVNNLISDDKKHPKNDTKNETENTTKNHEDYVEIEHNENLKDLQESNKKEETENFKKSKIKSEEKVLDNSNELILKENSEQPVKSIAEKEQNSNGNNLEAENYSKSKNKGSFLKRILKNNRDKSRSIPPKLNAKSNESEQDLANQTNFEQALNHFYNEQYYTAKYHFKRALLEQPDDEEARLYIAICEYETNNPEIALELLKQITQSKNQVLKQKAEYYIALSYIKSEKKDFAKVQLNKIIENNSSYKAKADSILQKL